MSEHQRFVFGPFLLDLRDERLWQEDEIKRLGTKAFAVLHCLVTQAGQLVRKETLLHTVWPETEVIEAVLTVAIRELRRALGDQARRPQFIETVHGRGYRFIAPIVANSTSPTAHGGEAVLPPPSPLTPGRPAIFVGRERECTQLQMWFTKALQGERQVGMIAGEPGIGKTALVDTFVAHLAATANVWVGHGQCIDHYGAEEAYLPVLEALTRLCRGQSGDQLVTLLRQYAPSWLVQMPALLSPGEREALGHSISGVTQARMLRELAEALEVMTEARPLVLVLEDLHWSDPSTLALLAYVSRRRDRARLLVFGTYRPADVIVQAHPLRRVLAELQQHNQCEHMTLDYLPEAAISSYVRERFGAKTAPGGFVRFLHQRSSGNPLFLIAMVDELMHQGILDEGRESLYVREGLDTVTGIVPENLSTLITQHIEQLSPADQAILEAASVAGMTFSVALVAAAVEWAISTIEARCATWARQGRFVQEHGIESWPDGTMAARYGFRHALYHEVVLRRISSGQRIHLHYCIGHRKETAYADQTQVIAAELAVHFEHAQEMHRAVLYRQKAAETALQRSAYREAMAHLTRGLTLVKSVPDTPERNRLALSLALMLGAALSATRGFGAPDVEHTYAQARGLAAHLGETSQLFIALAGLWRVYLSRGQLQKAKKLGEECLSLAQQAHDIAFLVESHYALGVTHFYLGAFLAAREHTEQGMALYNPQHHRALAVRYGGTDPGVACRCYAAQVLCVLGYPDAAVQCNQEALRLAEALEYPLSLAYALNQTLVLHQLRREGRAAQERAEEVMAFCIDQGFPQMIAMGTILRGWGLAEQGQAEEGIAQIRQGLSMNPEGIGLGGPPVLAQLAEAYGAAQRPEDGLALLAEAFLLVDKTEERWYEAELYRLKGELLLQLSSAHASEAESHLLQALNIAGHQQAKSFELRAAMSLSRLWQQQGKRDQACELLAPIYRWFTEGFDTADLREAKALLDELGVSSGCKVMPSSA